MLKVGLLIGISISFLSGNIFADDFETYPVIDSNQILSSEYLSSTYHRVESVNINNGFYEFEVESNIGHFTIVSLALLKKRVHEIKIVSQAIDRYQRENDGFSDELRSQLRISGDSAVDLLTSPFESASKLAGQLSDNFDATLAGENPYVPDSSKSYSLSEPKDPATATHKRNAAFQLGLDMYSNNTKVQSFLNAVANARAAGRVSAGVGFNSSNPLDRNKLDLEIAFLLKRNSLSELDNHIASKLSGIGIDRKLIEAFISHPVLSPSNKTTIVTYISQLNDVERLGSFFRMVLTAQNEVTALMFEKLSKMLVQYYQSTEQFSGFYNFKGQPAVLTESRRFVFFEYDDLFIWNEDKQYRYTKSARYAETSGSMEWEVVSLGGISALAENQLGKLSYKQKTNYLTY